MIRFSRPHRFPFGLAIMVVAAVCLLHNSARAEPQQWAVIIAVEKHADSRLNLQYTLNDAKQVRKTLLTRAGMPADHILEMTDESPADLRPALNNLRRELRRFLARAGAQDHLIIFFSGHGFLVQNQTYLVAWDNPGVTIEPSFIPIATPLNRRSHGGQW
jgi:uncharacterized caspase-like protein